MHDYWQPGADPAGYVALLRQTYAAIKSQNPNATVITAGLAPAANGGGNIAPIDFLRQVYAQGGEPYFDAVGFHPFSFPAMPSHVYTWNPCPHMADINPTF